MVKNSNQIEVIFFDIGGVLLHIHPEKMIKKISTITNIPGVFAAGDIVRGASLVVWAIRDGRDASISIQKYLENKLQEKNEAA